MSHNSFAGITYRTTITITYDDQNVPVTAFLNDPVNQIDITADNGSAFDSLYISDGDTLMIDNVIFDLSNFLLPVIVVIDSLDTSPGEGGMIYFKGGKGEMKLSAESNLFIDPENTDGISFNVGGGNSQGNGGPNDEEENVTGGNTLITAGEEKISTKEIARLIELGSLGSFLPVELISFQARTESNEVILTWRTAWEIDNDYFEVEHSRDGRRFAPLGRVEGLGTTDWEASYEFIHRDPAPGAHYYRLRQVDFDGAFEYSPVVAVQAGKGKLQNFTVFPNPARSRVAIRLPEKPTGQLRLLLGNNLGQTWPLRFDLRGEQLEVKLPDQLPAGLYWLHLQDGREQAAKPLMVVE